MKPEDFKGHQLPQAILSQINENSRGGFILLWISEDGEPQVSVQFDDAIHKRALVDFARDMSKMLKDLQMDEYAGAFCMASDPENKMEWAEEFLEEDDFDDDEDLF